ncbi:DNA cytosine methyltransferase [Plantactinospora sp. KLBMP9567]|uniref:DNA cytosine methyltransferase n=1 Tax=Plantactinospora sp. KLBMP9567 TaxID=3085900 RepID=UPI0029815D17|nr:DNA cytosine methyltransferase [Plantactinospora sp. KLBMP9567]MDW5327137.1 DNA cytosine methyltransferase [Plantactinospora sp. KLBMP9567]
MRLHRVRRTGPGRRAGARRPTRLVRRDRPARRHRPGPPLARGPEPRGDIRTVDWSRVESVDILTAGFPCQDISNAGKRVGITGERSGVWKHVATAVRVLRPPLLFVENVAALLTRGLDVVQADLAEIGYDTSWTCLRASDIGAAHRGDRLFLLATPSDRGGADVADAVRP